jgi:hypothetical protein
MSSARNTTPRFGPRSEPVRQQPRRDFDRKPPLRLQRERFVQRDQQRDDAEAQKTQARHFDDVKVMFAPALLLRGLLRIEQKAGIDV